MPRHFIDPFDDVALMQDETNGGTFYLRADARVEGDERVIMAALAMKISNHDRRVLGAARQGYGR